jgi:hypothetical protein
MSYNRAVTGLALAVLLSVLPRPAAAQNMDDIRLEKETWSVVGWNDACGVAVTRLSYPRLGDAIHGEPVMTRVGTLSIPTGGETASRRWTLTADGPLTWDARGFAKAEDDLRQAGFSSAGYPETIRDAAVGDQPGLAETIFSTATLSSRLPPGAWPGKGWRWAATDFNPLTTCALLVYESPARRVRFLLTRVYDPAARRKRAYAHASNARLLFDSGDLDGAAAEAATAAALDPGLGIARYNHAALLALTGWPNEAVAELAAAVRIDESYRTRAAKDRDFDGLRAREDFRDLIEAR